MAVTIQKIAELSGVSRGTVDRVLHGRPNVNPMIREKVVRAAEKLGYQPPVPPTARKSSRPRPHTASVWYRSALCATMTAATPR